MLSRSALCIKHAVVFLHSNLSYHPTDMMGGVIYMTFQSMTVGHGTHPTSCRRKRPGSRHCVMKSGTWPCTLTCWKRRPDKVGQAPALIHSSGAFCLSLSNRVIRWLRFHSHRIALPAFILNWISIVSLAVCATG